MDVGPQVVMSKSGQVANSVVVEIANRISCWWKIKRVVAYVRQFVNTCRKVKALRDHLSVQELNDAERMIVKDFQKRHFDAENADNGTRHNSSS